MTAEESNPQCGHLVAPSLMGSLHSEHLGRLSKQKTIIHPIGPNKAPKQKPAPPLLRVDPITPPTTAPTISQRHITELSSIVFVWSSCPDLNSAQAVPSTPNSRRNRLHVVERRDRRQDQALPAGVHCPPLCRRNTAPCTLAGFCRQSRIRPPNRVQAAANTFPPLAGPRRCVPYVCRIQRSASSMRIRTRRLPIFKCGKPRAIRLSTWRGENCHRCAYPRLSVMFVVPGGAPPVTASIFAPPGNSRCRFGRDTCCPLAVCWTAIRAGGCPNSARN